MRELALFAGAGGGLLGSILAGWSTVAACEVDARCREILLARQRDGILARFPIWDDIRTFDGHGLRGLVDIVTGGFPCQRFSTATRGRGVAEDLWPDMLRIIGEVQPSHVLAENVLRDPIERAAMDLQRVGYHCTILKASAAAVGAPHPRVRWWVAANTHVQEQHVQPEHGEVARVQTRAVDLWSGHPSCDRDVDDGLASGMDVYSRAVGNGQVPQMVHAIARYQGWLDHPNTRDGKVEKSA